MSDPDIAALSANIASAIIGQGDLDAAVADLRRLPASMPVRAKFAAGLVAAIMRSGALPGPARMRELGFLVELAEQDPPADPQWPRHRTAARVASLMHASMEGTLGDPRAALNRLDELEREGGGDPALRPLFSAARMGLGFARTVQDDDMGAMSRLPTEMAEFLERMPRGDPRMDQLRDLLGASADAMAARRTGGDFGAGLRRMRQVAEGLEPGDELREMATESLSALDAMLGPTPGADAERLDDDRLAALVALADRPGLSDPDRALYHAQVAAAALCGGTETDLDRVELGVGHFRRALDRTAPDDPQRPLHLVGLAVGLLRQSELTSTTAGRREARTHLDEARALAGGPHHPQWQLINEMLGEIDRMLGDTPDYHRTAVDGLRGHVWQVLVQSDLAGASAAVRTAAADAVEVARRCLAANDPESAIAALDAGRGLALFAATGLRTLAERLDAVDAGLAERWRAAAAAHDAGRIPGELRRSVLTALAGHSTAVGLLDPPALQEIQQALVTVDADALVYLVPGAGTLAGYAVVAPAAGPPSYLALPGLAEVTVADMEQVLTHIGRREAATQEAAAHGAAAHEAAAHEAAAHGAAIHGAATHTASGHAAVGHEAATHAAATRDFVMAGPAGDLDAGLARMCEWAWDAAIGPLITSYLPRVPRAASGRPHRVVLVPMGDLARVPWQAARRADGRYAVQEIAISQAASARMLCHSAALPPVPASPVGLLVGDPDTRPRKSTPPDAEQGDHPDAGPNSHPDTGPDSHPRIEPGTNGDAGGARPVAPDLAAARLEAYAIRQALYPGARYVGRRPDADGSVSPSGAGSAREVREWLTTDHPAAGSMLHLACHGFVRAGHDAPTAYLLLAGGEQLTAAELVALMAGAPRRGVELVVLAACRTGLAMTGYDEAYSLGTAFLAGGARSVLSTQWSIPDSATSALMFMFHRNLRTTGGPAWQALRDAQLWMLDPARETPADMPRPLAGQLDRAGLDAVAAWAAFVHWGQ